MRFEPQFGPTMFECYCCHRLLRYVFENPWLSYLWLMPEMLALIGLPGLYLVRIDQCMHDPRHWRKHKVTFHILLR